MSKMLGTLVWSDHCGCQDCWNRETRKERRRAKRAERQEWKREADRFAQEDPQTPST